MSEKEVYRCKDCGDYIEAPGLCDYHYAFREGKRVESLKYQPLKEAVEELLALGDMLVEQEPAIMKIEKALEILRG